MSAKFVLKVLQYEGPQTQKDICDQSLLPSRTVRYALTELKKRDLIDQYLSLKDSRQSIYISKQGLEIEDAKRQAYASEGIAIGAIG